MSLAVKAANDNPDGNKMVGCVVVKNGVILSTGFRRKFIVNDDPLVDITVHAEHMALLIAGDKSKGATIYTTLEPCTVRCKTPGDIKECCCDLITEYGIECVVIKDIDTDFGGGGIAVLESKGIKVKLLTDV